MSWCRGSRAARWRAPLWVLFATLAGTALYGLVGAIFAVPLVAIIAATLRYLRGTVIFERWGKPPSSRGRGEGGTGGRDFALCVGGYWWFGGAGTG